MSSVESGRFLGVIARVRERAVRPVKDLLLLKKYYPVRELLTPRHLRLEIYRFLQENGHQVFIDTLDSESETIEVKTDEKSSRLERQIFSSPEIVALSQATLYGSPGMVENFLQQADLYDEIKEKIMQLARLRAMEREIDEFNKALDEHKSFLDEEASLHIKALREIGERKFEEQKAVVLASGPEPITEEEKREVLNSVYERLTGEKGFFKLTVF